MKIETITLRALLPAVFAEERGAFSASEIWLKNEVVFRKGEATIIRAASGTGKTSLMSFIFGLRKDYSGTLLFNDTDSRTLDFDSWQSLRRSSLSYLPQEMKLFPELTALENIMLKNRLTDFKTEREIRAMMEAIEIDNRADYLASKMSLGQQQRVAAVRALCQPFDFLLLDEPVSHLDDGSNSLLASLVTTEVSKQKAGLIVTSVGNDLNVNKESLNLLSL